jgi:hypothetical protein
VGKGDTTTFWKDIWNFGSLHHLYPQLFFFTKEPNCSISRFLSMLPDYGRLFQLELLIVASHQLVELVDSIDEWNREGNDTDRWTYIWGSEIFQSRQAYQNIIGQAHAYAPF